MTRWRMIARIPRPPWDRPWRVRARITSRRDPPQLTWRGGRSRPERRVTRSAAARPPVPVTAGTTSTGATARPASGTYVADGEMRAPARGMPRRRSRLRFCRAPATGLEERGQLAQGLSTARFVVLRPNACRDVLAQDRNAGSLAGIRESRRDLHVAGEARVLRFECDDFHDLLVRHQFDESALESIRVIGGLAAERMCRVLVGERHPIRAAFPRVEDVHLAFHAVGHPPCSQGVRIEAGPVHGLARRLDDRRDLRARAVAG